MKKKIKALLLMAVCILTVLPCLAQYPAYKSFNGKYVKKGKDYTIEAKIDFNGIAKKGVYFNSEGEEIEYDKYYGYIKLISGDQQEGFDIVNVIPSGDGPIFELAGWQFPKAIMIYPSFYNGTLQMDSGSGEYEPYLQETLKKVP